MVLIWWMNKALFLKTCMIAMCEHRCGAAPILLI